MDQILGIINIHRCDNGNNYVGKYSYEMQVKVFRV